LTARRHFIFNDDHERLRESIGAFVEKELAPHAEEWEETTFPDWVFRRMGELGFLGLSCPEEYGGQGGHHVMWELQGERMIGAAGSVAAAQRCFDRTLEYALERKAFGRQIGRFQVTRHKFAEMATKIDSARQQGCEAFGIPAES